MRLGTKSLLFGAHQFLIHPLYLALAWTKLFGFPRDYRLWVAFFVHDWGYFGADMSGESDLNHPNRGAKLLHKLFDKPWDKHKKHTLETLVREYPWYYFSLLHSRNLAEYLKLPPSRLAVADKLALVLTPTWLWCLCTTLSGEGSRFMCEKDFGLRNPSKSLWLEAAKLDSKSWMAYFLSNNWATLGLTLPSAKHALRVVAIGHPDLSIKGHRV